MGARPLVVIVGPTASGKTALAIALAKKFNGEIICADSRTVYEGMDIGTAKPTKAEQAEVKHHLLDVVEPDQPFNVADFKRLALGAINDISNRGKLPIMAGGSGLYIDSVTYDFEFNDKPDSELRERLNSLSVEELQEIINEKGLSMPVNSQNKRHLTRTIETEGREPIKHELRPDTLVIGLQVDREVLKKRIAKRVDQMVEQGLVEEVKTLGERYGWEHEALQTPGYKAFKNYLNHKLSLEEAKALFSRGDQQLAKRQMTWLKRNKDIQWLADPSKSVEIVATFIEQKK